MITQAGMKEYKIKVVAVLTTAIAVTVCST
jgi:hypothetical protein